MVLNKRLINGESDDVYCNGKKIKNIDQSHLKSVIQAEKYFRRQYPQLYPIISGYANCRHFDELEESVVSARITVRGYGWQVIRPFFLKLCNVKKVSELKGEEEGDGKQTRLPASTYLTTKGSGEVSLVRKGV